MNFQQILIAFFNYALPIVAILVSVLVYIDTRKVNRFQNRLNEIDEKLKKIELEEKEKERNDATKACIEARLVNISNNNHRMKFWNSGKAIAYNINFICSVENRPIVMKDKVPYEFLESGKSFEEIALISMSTPAKFKITTIWNDKDGQEYSKEQIVSISS